MSAQKPTSITEWLQSLPIPWLVGGTNGRADVTAYGASMDAEVSRTKEAVKARMPDYAPTDALPHIGGDRKLIQGPSETAANFKIRLKTAWDDWSRAGTWAELLTQLYWQGYTSAIIAQQNGLLYTLSGAPTPGVDPTSLVTITPAGTLTVAVSSSVHIGVSIPAGNPWWYFDGDVEFCSRFAILLPTLPAFFPPSAAVLATLKTTVNTWRPAKATCMGVFALTSGLMWGRSTWGAGVWGGVVTVYPVAPI